MSLPDQPAAAVALEHLALDWYDADAPPAVGLTVGTDLSDPGSPCGNVHIRNKTAVGARTALAARALA